MQRIPKATMNLSKTEEIVYDEILTCVNEKMLPRLLDTYSLVSEYQVGHRWKETLFTMQETWDVSQDSWGVSQDPWGTCQSTCYNIPQEKRLNNVLKLQGISVTVELTEKQYTMYISFSLGSEQYTRLAQAKNKIVNDFEKRISVIARDIASTKTKQNSSSCQFCSFTIEKDENEKVLDTELLSVPLQKYRLMLKDDNDVFVVSWENPYYKRYIQEEKSIFVEGTRKDFGLFPVVLSTEAADLIFEFTYGNQDNEELCKTKNRYICSEIQSLFNEYENVFRNKHVLTNRRHKLEEYNIHYTLKNYTEGDMFLPLYNIDDDEFYWLNVYMG
jgi:hypothetical protein